MKIKVDSDELYPIYQLYDFCGKEVEVTEEFHKEYTEVMDKFWNMQRTLSDLYHGEDDDESPYAFCNMPESTDDEDEKSTLTFKVKDRYNFSWEDKV
jgi:hypothetical protein